MEGGMFFGVGVSAWRCVLESRALHDSEFKVQGCSEPRRDMRRLSYIYIYIHIYTYTYIYIYTYIYTSCRGPPPPPPKSRHLLRTFFDDSDPVSVSFCRTSGPMWHEIEVVGGALLVLEKDVGASGG